MKRTLLDLGEFIAKNLGGSVGFADFRAGECRRKWKISNVGRGSLPETES